MKTLKNLVLLTVALTLVNCGVALAELTPSQIVSQFNNLGTNGWAFDTRGSIPSTFTATNSSLVPDLSAYASGSLNSFCVNMNLGAISRGVATLSYNADTGRTQNASNVALSVGGALLYQQYAAGLLPVVLGSISIDTSIRALNNATSVTAINWSQGFYAYLYSLKPDSSYWIANYNVNQRYDEIGDHAVFVMNIKGATGTANYQDFLYVARADYGGNNDVPEPATLLLWTLGSAGAFGFNHYRKRNKKA